LRRFFLCQGERPRTARGSSCLADAARGAGAAIVLIALVLALPACDRGATESGDRTSPLNPEVQSLPEASSSPSRASETIRSQARKNPADIATFLASVRSAQAPLDGEGVESLLVWLRGLDRASAVEGIRRFLDAGQDCHTGQEFAVGAQGITHSGIRALLLDELGRIDPEVAAQVSRQLLDGAEPLTVDVQATALRNVAAVAGEPLTAEERDYFRGAWEKIAARPGVQDGSCPVSLAALDLAVFLGDEALLAPLFELRQRAASPEVADAIERVTERLVSRVPTRAVNELASGQKTFDQVPELRARLLARVDLAHPSEQRAVRAFLTDPRTPKDALQAFLLRYPNDQETLSPGIFDAGHEPLLDETVRSDESALQVVRQWQADPTMAGAAEALSVMALRLEGLLQDRVTGE
jgi:hypothetical protein